MSAGIPRNLLIILKEIYKWSVFFGESTSDKLPIFSWRAQQSGLNDACDWYISDAQFPGGSWQKMHIAYERLAKLFKEIRFSDKPTECKLCVFDTRLSECSTEVQSVVKDLMHSGLLLMIDSGRSDKNKSEFADKFQLNPMVCAKWDLSTVRGGSLNLTSAEAEVVFGSANSDEFERFCKDKTMGMNAPFRIKIASHNVNMELFGEDSGL
jgi:hypothetical protein